MKTAFLMIGGAVALLTAAVFPRHTSSLPISGDYVEVRSCDVYTGPCFANGEMGLTGREAIMTWSVDRGTWQGVPLDGLKVLAVVEAQDTLGNVRQESPAARSVVVVDAAADSTQRQALVQFAQHMAGPLLDHVVRVDAAPIDVEVHPASCPSKGCAKVRADGLVDIQTRCLGGKDHLCGNEECFYPPLTTIGNARPAYTMVASFRGEGLGLTFNDASRRSAYLGTFGE